MFIGKCLRSIWFLGLLLVVALPVYGQSTGLTIMSHEAGLNNLVEARVAVTDALGQPISNLSSSSFSVSENNAGIEVTQVNNQPIIFAIAINQAYMTPEGWGVARGVLQIYLQNYLQDGDTVLISYFNAEDGQVIKEGSTVQAVSALLDEISLGQADDTFNASFAGDLISRAQRLQSSGMPRAIHAMYIAQRLNARSVTRSGLELFAARNIPLHILDVDTRQQNKEFAPLITGEYAGLVSNGGFINDEGASLSRENLPIFSLMKVSRATYTLRYQATSSAPGERKVTISTAQGSANFTYTATFSPPIVTEFKGNLDVSRVFVQAGSNELTPSTNPFSVRVTFDSPESLTRNLTSLVMNVYEGSTLVGRYEATSLTPNGEGNYTFNWPLDSYAEPKTVYNVDVEVVATDQSGLITTSQKLPVKVTVGEPPLTTDPAVIFTKINQNPKRNFTSQTELDKDTLQTITMLITIPDGYAAVPKQLTLTIKGEDGVPISKETKPLTANDREVIMTWDIADFTAPSSTNRVLVQAMVELTDGKQLFTSEEEFVITVGAPLPAERWMLAPLFELVGMQSPVDASANLPTTIAVALLVGVIVYVFMRYTTVGQAATVAATTQLNKTLQVVRNTTQNILGNRRPEILGMLEWRSVSQSGSINIDREAFVVGRTLTQGSHAEIPIGTVSGQHFRIIYHSDDHSFTIEDLGSTNHTYLKDDRLAPGTPKKLFNEDEITIARSNENAVTIRFVAARNTKTMDVRSADMPDHTIGIHNMTDPNRHTLGTHDMNQQAQEAAPVVDDVDAHLGERYSAPMIMPDSDLAPSSPGYNPGQFENTANGNHMPNSEVITYVDTTPNRGKKPKRRGL